MIVTGILDASALLAFLQGERGAEVVAGLLAERVGCSVVNWSEVAQKTISRNGDWRTANALLRSFELVLIEATEHDAEAAARLHRPKAGLSLADRFCIATASRLSVPAWTADASWGECDLIRQIR